MISATVNIAIRLVEKRGSPPRTFHRPEELKGECTNAGLTIETLVAIEGPWWLLQDLGDRLGDPMRREQLLTALRRIESEPSLLGVSAHLLAVGRPT